VGRTRLGGSAGKNKHSTRNNSRHRKVNVTTSQATCRVHPPPPGVVGVLLCGFTIGRRNTTGTKTKPIRLHVCCALQDHSPVRRG